MTVVNVSTWVDVEVDLEDIDTDDLEEELASRGKTMSFDNMCLLDVIWQKRRTNQDYQAELDQLIYNELGKII